MTAMNALDRLMSWFNALGLGPLDFSNRTFEPICADYARHKHDAFNVALKAASNVDVNKFNPLSKVTAGNPWAAQYENQNRVNEIKLDVDRTYQEMPFFTNIQVQKSLINMLFIFGKSHDLAYRQGMNEICAILFYVVSEGLDKCSELGPDDDPLEVKESITLAMFSKLMIQAEMIDFFFSHSVLHKQAAGSEQDKKSSSPLLRRCENIFDLLRQKDARLHKHLIMNDISPNLFLLRWIRLLFSREFSFHHTLLIWDHIFTSNDTRSGLTFPCVIDYVAIAMILNVKQTLMISDNAGCFTTLLRYPDVPNIQPLLDLATQIRTGESPLPIIRAPSGTGPERLAVVASQTRRDRVISDLSSVVDDLRKSDVSKSIQREIARLEELISFIRPSVNQ